MYSLREFRANTKKAFDEAEVGVVYIKRGDKTYKLVMGGAERVNLVKQVSELKPALPPKNTGNCKNGHALDWRGKCFGKGCKYGV